MLNLIDNFFILAQSTVEPSVFTYFADSNFAGKVIVLLLMLFSILAWSVMFGKYADLESLRKLNLNTESILSKSKSVIDVAVNHSKKIRGPYASLLKESIVAWHRYENSENNNEDLSVRMGLVENALQRSISRQIIRYENKMVLLGSIISGAPFLGLLGTTWGVMDSFGAMTTQTSATLQMLAPGVSGALLTTVAGLVVAIPSVFGYNFLLVRTKTMVTELENFASSLADRIELDSKMNNAKAPIQAITPSPIQAQYANQQKQSPINRQSPFLNTENEEQNIPSFEQRAVKIIPDDISDEDILDFDDDQDTTVSPNRYGD